MQLVNEMITVVIEACCNCGVQFGLEEKHRKQLLKTGNTFYCPNGHAQIFSNSTEAQLRQAKENEKWWKDRAEEKAAELATTRGELTVTRRNLTRTKNRIAKGICPCCKRQFVDLHRHMEGQHPDYQKE